MESTGDSPRMRKARPERIRYTLFDDGAGAVPIPLPTQRHWMPGLIIAVFFLVFASVLVGMIYRMDLHRMRDVFDLMMFLFDAFWVIGWSVGVLILGVLTVLFLFYRESARLQNGRLVHVPRIGPLKIVCEYDLEGISNLRLEPAKDGQLARIRFEYAGGRARLGDAMEPEDAQAAIDQIRRAAPGSARLTETNPPAREPAPMHPRADSPAAPVHVSHGPATWASPSNLALLAANLLPLAGVLMFDWDLWQVMVLYWAESAVIGFYTVLKLCVVAKPLAVFAVPFFVGHFGAFMAAHFVFVYGFFIRGFASGPLDFGPLEGLIDIFAPISPALAALAVSHGVSFALNFIGRKEYAGETIQSLMTAPYKRIVIMHLTIIFGGALVLALDTPAPALALLVLIKTAVDLRAHRREHGAIAKSDEKE